MRMQEVVDVMKKTSPNVLRNNLFILQKSTARKTYNPSGSFEDKLNKPKI
jgi:hypothetical protein